MKRYLTIDQLILRWQEKYGILYNRRTLENWRYMPKGPVSVKVQGRRVYRVEDVEAYESSGGIEAEGH